jgi:epoxyqueuosine reductase
MDDKTKHGRWIKAEARRLGFSGCGFSSVRYLSEEAQALEFYLRNGYNGTMGYMENHFEKRLNPALLVEGAKTVISLSCNYFPTGFQTDPEAPVLSKYAFGRDYHFVIKEKLKYLTDFIEEKIGPFNGRIFTDSAPVLERAWAKQSGLGWIGKNGNLITRGTGSFFFLSEIICDLDLEPDNPVKNHCGSCTRCIDHCPTQAIVKPGVIDARRCISYLTIELKEEIPDFFKPSMQNRVFGCDICQDVCPWNRFSQPHHEPEFTPDPALMKMKREEWYEITEEVFKNLFSHSPVKRTGFKGLSRNLRFIEPEEPSGNNQKP